MRPKMDSTINDLYLLSLRINAIQEILSNYNEFAVAGIHIKKSSFKHPHFCTSEYYQITDLVSGEIILELQGDKNGLEVVHYKNAAEYWLPFMKLSHKIQALGKSLRLVMAA